MTRSPWLKFYPADWRSDTALRSCSCTARAVWIDLLGLMHEAEPYGHLLINGVQPSVKALSGLLNVHHKTLRAALIELSDKGVFSRDSKGVIYSRRMVRDHQKSLQDKENGRRGGNPGLTPRLTQPPPVEDKAQKPEARSQNVVLSSEAAEWKARLEEAKARAGAALNLTNGNVHHWANLKRMVAAGCDWNDDILTAIDAASARMIQRGQQFHGWDYIEGAAIQNRDRRLAGLPAPQAITAINGTHAPKRSGRGGIMAGMAEAFAEEARKHEQN